MKFTGGCLCGAVRYECADAPLMTRVCWCRDCQYLAAGSGTVNAFFRTESVAIQGAVQTWSSTADSGNLMYRRFCARCGTAMFAASARRPHLMVVRAGTLDDPNLVQPSVTIWTASAPRWACIDATLPRVERQPPPPPDPPAG